MSLFLFCRYTSRLGEAKNIGIKKAIASKLSLGFVYLIINGCYGLAFWYGTTLILEDNSEYTIGSVLAVSNIFWHKHLSKTNFITRLCCAYSILAIAGRMVTIGMENLCILRSCVLSLISCGIGLGSLKPKLEKNEMPWSCDCDIVCKILNTVVRRKPSISF